MPETTLAVQRWAMAAMVFLSATAFWLPAVDPINVVKLTAVLACGIVATGAAAVRVLTSRRIQVPRGPVAAVLGTFGVALVVATIVADTRYIAVVGQYGRNTGLALYGSGALVVLLIARAFDRSTLTHLIGAILVTAGVVATYGLVQATGLEPFPWNKEYGAVISTLGNPNFVSGWLSIATPLALWGALTTRAGRVARVACGVLAGLCVVVAVLTTSIQGPLAAAVALTFLLSMWLLGRSQRTRRRGLIALGSVGIAATGVLVTALAGAGPLAAELEQSLVNRRWYWAAAVDMFADRPVAGVGLDMYASYYRAFRPLGATRALGVDNAADAPHSVPLGMFANGGMLLGLAYLAVVVAVGWVLVSGLRRTVGEDRLLVAAVGAAWLAYHVQSLVSIDQPAIAILHWVLAGAVLAACGIGLRWVEVPLPGAAAAIDRERRTAARTQKARRRGQRAPASSQGRGAWPALVATSVVGLFALWVASLPMRTDAAAGRAARLVNAGRPGEALAVHEQISGRLPWEASYWFDQGRVLESLDRLPGALDAHRQAARYNPRARDFALRAAQVSRALGEEDAAADYYDQVVRIDPTGAEILVEVAEFHLGRGSGPEAVDLLRTAVRVRPEQAPWWKLLGDAERTSGEPERARAAYRRALEIDPSLTAAQDALAALPPA